MTRKCMYKWLMGCGMCAAVLIGLTAAMAATVVDPQDGLAAITRTDDAGGSIEVIYVVVSGTDAAAIKYEDAMDGDSEACLGEDGAGQTDTFVIEVEGAGDSVTVETKASTETATTMFTTSVSGEGASQLDDNGFRVSLVSIEDGLYTLEVTSEEPPHALSHVTFTFAEGQRADATYD